MTDRKKNKRSVTSCIINYHRWRIDNNLCQQLFNQLKNLLNILCPHF